MSVFPLPVYTHNAMKNKPKISTIVITSIVVVSAIAGGLALGIYFGKSYYDTGKDYSVYSVLDYEDDNAALFEEYKNGKAISEFEPYQLVNISLEQLKQEKSFQSITHGNVDAALVQQSIFAEDVKNGNEYYTESVSYSNIVKCAVRFYQTDDTVTEYWGHEIKSNGDATWADRKGEEMTSAEHEDTWGKTLDRPVIYIISSKTVLESEVTETEEGYEVTMSLDPTTSVLRYIKQMCSISNLKKNPEFRYVNLSFKLDKELNMIQETVKENYVVFVVGTNESTATLTIDYKRGEDFKIPGLDELYPY